MYKRQLKTQVFLRDASAQKHFFRRGACVRLDGGALVPWHNGTMASPTLHAAVVVTSRLRLSVFMTHYEFELCDRDAG